jgi:hypothetical protein
MLIVLLVASLPVFYLFTYNTGYGYDQLEYLIIGKSLAAGESFYSIIPSKGIGIYAIVAGALIAGLDLGHASLSLLITLVYLLMLSTTFIVVRSFFNTIVALVSAFLLALCSVFMELNFLQPTGIVYLFGIIAYYFAIRATDHDGFLNTFIAGIMLGIGFHFKSIALFYMMGMVLFFALWAIRSRQIAQAVQKWIPGLAAGFILSIGVVLLYFTITNRFHEFWLWTFYFPVFKYPGNTMYLSKMFTKLLWFHLMLLATFLISFQPAIRTRIYSDKKNILIILLGFTSYLALLKTQASHYCFPGAGFFSIFITVVLFSMKEMDVHRVSLSTLKKVFVIAFVGCISISSILYRPEAFKRFITIKDYRQDKVYADIIHGLSSGGSYALFFNNAMYLYWISKLHPAVPYADIYVQVTWWLKQHPEILLNALDDPMLSIVEFNLESVGVSDQFYDPKANYELLKKFAALLDEKFVRVPTSLAGYTFWQRKVIR